MHRSPALAEVLTRALKGDHARKRASGAPDAAAEARELDDLRVVDEEVRAGALVLDVVRKDVRVCCLEPDRVICISKNTRQLLVYWKQHMAGDLHDFVGGEGGGHRRDDVRSPVLDVLCDTFAFDHDHLVGGE